MRLTWPALLALCSLFLSTGGAWAAGEASPPAYFTLTFENDFFFDSDDDYSNGVQLAWAYGPFDQFGGNNTSELTAKLAPRWIRNGEGYQRAVTHKFANVMSTPDDLEATVPPPGNMPYSGITFFRTDWLRSNDVRADRAWGTIGLVGEISGSEWAQENMHEIIGATIPMGWDTQVENGVVAELGAARSWRPFVRGNDDRGTDIVLVASGNLGNLTTRVDTGVVVRAGRNLTRSFPAASILPGRDANPVAGASVDTPHVFAGVQYRYEAWNICIDGDTPAPYDPNITRVPSQFYVAAGAAGNIGALGLTLAFAKGSKRYEEADTGDWFGSLGITWRYR